jgi:sugar lactone lactonase YvrE
VSSLHADPVTPALAFHGEGPVWDVRAGRLHFVDMLAGDLLTLDPAGGGAQRRHLAAEVLAVVRPRAGGGLVLGVERGFALLDEGAGTPRALPPLWEDRGVRMNEGACDPRGRFYCGSMAYDQAEGRGALHRLDPDGTTTVVLPSVTVSNGLVWTPDGGTDYYVDSATGRVDAFAVDADGELTDRRPFAAVPGDAGVPDGIALDAEGGLWVAVNGGGAVHRYDPDGRLDAVVEVPVTGVTACAFGGPDLAELYVTTSREGLEPGEQPLAGALFGCTPGGRGVPVHTFAG